MNQSYSYPSFKPFNDKNAYNYSRSNRVPFSSLNSPTKYFESSVSTSIPFLNMTRQRLRSPKTIIFLILLFAIVSFLYLKPKYYNHIGSNHLFYTIVIDAGSTGSRIHVFKLDHDKFANDEKFDIKLINEELFVKVKPGLSSYHNNPDQATESIKPLLDKALSVIPQEHHGLARLSLKATAGLRMISDEIANRILNNVRKLFEKYPFVKKSDDVEILDGKYEGIYSWLTLNYALNNYETGNEYSSCSLDLGGGSTQVTFLPKDDYSLSTSDKDYLVRFKLDQTNYKIFARSFLGFGLMSARMNIFKLDTLNFLRASTPASNELFSVCMPPNHKSTWLQQAIEYTVHGPDTNEQHSYDKCYANVIKTIENKIDAPTELRTKEIYAFSYYFDRINSAKLFKDHTGGPIQVQAIQAKAKSICDNPSSPENSEIDRNDKDYPYLCMDLTFIHALLTQGFGLQNEKFINVHNEVNKMEISWALGAAFHMLND